MGDIPSYDQFIEPLLRVLARHPDGVPAGVAARAAADALGLSDEDREARVPSGDQAVYKNRAGWAHDRLKRTKLSSCPKRGLWKITAEGMEFVRKNPGPLAPGQVDQVASAHLTVRLGDSTPRRQAPAQEASPSPATSPKTPNDQIDHALKDIRESVASDLLDSLSKTSPRFFEQVVLDVLLKIGYGAKKEDLQRVGGSQDAGIDGVISLDRLGLEKVYVQAKRWQNQVGRPEVQAFYGALAGQRARKGVFITTSWFTQQAVEFARSVEGVVLVDGKQLADLMIDHAVGVSLRAVHIPRIDSDFFEED